MGLRLKGYWQKSVYIKQGKRGYWSKWGGGIGYKEEDSQWVCQACGLDMWQLPHFSFKLDDVFIKVCPMCYWTANVARTVSFVDLIGLVRTPELVRLFTSLPTLSNFG